MKGHFSQTTWLGTCGSTWTLLLSFLCLHKLMLLPVPSQQLGLVLPGAAWGHRPQALALNKIGLRHTHKKMEKVQKMQWNKTAELPVKVGFGASEDMIGVWKPTEPGIVEMTKLLQVLQEYKALHEKSKSLRKVVKWKPMLILALPESLITEIKLGSRQHQSWALLNSKDRQDFIKKVSQPVQMANKLFWNDAKCKRNDKSNLKEPGRKLTWVLPASLTMGLKSSTFQPTHTQNPQVALHPKTWAGHLLAGMMAEDSTNEGFKMEHASWCLNLLPWSSRKNYITKLSDLKLNQEVLRPKITQKFFTLINDCICSLWDMDVGALPEVLKAEELQESCTYLEY